ncbi:MAG: hypothetical protein WC358_07390 [Ignavibacteria bacterium]|jgi:hypothetical protein
MSQENLTFTEYVTLLLTQLYDYELKNRPGEYINLGDLSNNFKQKIPNQWAFDAGKVLESRGLAKCIFALGGLAMASLTGEGRMFIEKARDEENNVAKVFKDKPETYINIQADNVNIATGNNNTQTINIESGRKELFDILKEIKEYINKSGIENKNDLISDLDSIESQIKKKEPNKSIIADLLEPFGKIIDIAGKVANFINLINL